MLKTRIPSSLKPSGLLAILYHPTHYLIVKDLASRRH
jgi:hypothetical protein